LWCKVNYVQIGFKSLFKCFSEYQILVDTITNIKDAYGVAKNWQGDPCGPVKYMWEGLNCSIDGYSIPRITSL